MATNRKRTPRGRRESNLSPDQLDWLYDRPTSNRSWRFFAAEGVKRALWDTHKQEVLRDWEKASPCTRPSLWWLYDAPKGLLPGCDESDFFGYQAVRQRLGGIGTPSPEVLNIAPHFHLGIPTSWVTQWQADYYNGKAKGIHGAPIGTNYKEGHFKGVPIDPDDPPRYESQAAYLQRHGLLTKEERAHMVKHPELLEPDTVNPTTEITIRKGGTT